MSDRIIKTGLSKKYKDMLDSVLGQMSDGYWENTPMMQGYYKFCDIGTADGEITIEVDATSGEREGNRFIENRFYRMPDDAVKKFFADKIKFLIKEEGLGKWDRGNERETDFLSYGRPHYRVKDCYYAYEILKGRNARKHPEYGDVAEANMKTNEGHLGELLEEVAQVTGALTYSDAWRLDAAADDDKGFRKKVRDLLNDFEDAAYDGDEAEMENVAKKLKELADGEVMIMPRIKMVEKMSAYQVTFLADKPGEIGAKLYAKKVFAGNERDAVIAFNGWFDSCKAFPEGSSCDIQKVELIQSEGANKSYTFTWWDNEPAADRRPTTRADLKNCLHKEIFLAADDAEALKLAVEYLCDYIGDDPEDVADTPEEIWDYFNGDWGAGDPIPMVLKQRSRVVKDSGFDPNGEDDESKKHEGSGVGDMTALINAVDRAHTKETLPLQAELHRLKERRTARVKEILGDKVKDYFEDLGYEVPWVYLDWPSVSLTLKGSIDEYYFTAHPEVVLKSAYISRRSSLDPDHNKVITNYGEKYRRIPIDYNKRFTSQTPKPLQEKYFELLEALKGITKFASLVEKDPEIQELNDKIQDVASSIKVHPLLSPGIT